VPNFRIYFHGCQLTFLPTHPESEEERQKSVSGVAKHDAEQEGKGDDGVDGRVGLAVRRHAVGVNQFLEGRRKLVRPEESGGTFLG